MSEKEKKEKFLEKHPPKTDEQIKQIQREAKYAKDKYSKDMEEVEKNLLGYFDIEEPIIDPETNKAIAWMKIPSNMLLEDYFGLTGGKTSLQELSKEEVERLRDKEYELMEQLITRPSKDKDWWRQHLNPKFSKLVRIKLWEFFEEIGGVATNFLEAEEDSV